LAGETLESVEIVTQMAKVLPIWEKQGKIKPGELPLLRLLCRVVTQDEPAEIPFDLFFT
jgi:hypothetical protein